MRSAIVCIMLMVFPEIPSLTRWLTCFVCLGWWMVGIAFNDLFEQGFQLAWGKFMNGIGVNQEDVDNADDGDADGPGEDWKATAGKRLKRGAGF